MNIQRDRRRLTGRELKGQTYERLDLRGALAAGSRWHSCTFKNVRFGQAVFEQATFTDCSFEGCDFGQARLVSTFRNCSFHRCDFSQTQFFAAHVSLSTFRRCRFQYASFAQAAFVDVNLFDCDFHGANLDLMASERVDWTGSSFWGAVIPINCAFIVGNTFDKDQVHRFLALLLHAKGDWRGLLAGITDFKARMLVDRLVDEATREEGVPAEAEPAGDDDGGGLRDGMEGQEMAERDSDGAFGGLRVVGRIGEEA